LRDNLCAACTTACPITWTNEEFVGPAAIVNAHRFIFDSRDEGSAVRLDILNDNRLSANGGVGLQPSAKGELTFGAARVNGKLVQSGPVTTGCIP